MGKTVIEKIIQAHTADEVAPGKIVWMDLDIRSARDFGGPNVVKNYEREYAGLPWRTKPRRSSPLTFALRPAASNMPTISRSAETSPGRTESRFTTWTAASAPTS